MERDRKHLGEGDTFELLSFVPQVLALPQALS